MTRTTETVSSNIMMARVASIDSSLTHTVVIERHVEMLGGKEWEQTIHQQPRTSAHDLVNATGQIQKLTTGNAQRCLKLPGILDVTRKREETVALRRIGTHSLEPLNTVADDAGNGRNGFNVVDNGGTRVQTFGSRERRLQARLATTAFEGIEKCGLLTTDVGRQRPHEP